MLSVWSHPKFCCFGKEIIGQAHVAELVAYSALEQVTGSTTASAKYCPRIDDSHYDRI